MNTSAVQVAPPDPARVASAQRLLIASMAILLVAIAVDYGLGRTPLARWASLGFEFVAIVVAVVGIVRMGRAMASPLWLTIVCCIAALVGILNLIVLAWLNSRAMAVLRAAGWKVGFFGASAPKG